MTNHQMPSFSIVVPTYNRQASLARCLESLTRLEYPRDRFEVIVVDDESALRPQAVVSRFDALLDVKLVTQSHSGPAAARNLGAQRATGEFVAFIDDDCTADPGWVRALANRFSTHGGGGGARRASAKWVAAEQFLDGQPTVGELLVCLLQPQRRSGAVFHLEQLCHAARPQRLILALMDFMPGALSVNPTVGDRIVEAASHMVEWPGANGDHAKTD